MYIPTISLLEKHVRESNAIEGIFVGKNHYLFDDHLSAAGLVVTSAIESKSVAMPERVHWILMQHDRPSDAGKFRNVWVRVGPYKKPSPETVPILMNRWSESLTSDINQIGSLPLDKRGGLAWHYHNWFEAIHPFIDGNGRTGRLILNNIRLLCDLPWLIVLSSEKDEYYQRIPPWELKHRHLLHR